MFVVVRSLAFVCLAAGVPAHSCAQRSQRTPEPTSPSTTLSVDVRLQTREGYDSAAPPARGIQVELGIAASEDSERDATPPLHLGEPVLAHAVSDEQGWIEARVRLPLAWKERAGPIWVRVASPGYVKSVAYVALKTIATDVVHLPVRRGGTLLGSARTADGAPLAGARVWLAREANDTLTHTWGETTRGDGSFALSFFSAGRYHVHVRSTLHGSSSDVAVELDPERGAEPVTLAVGGGVDVRGRLVDPELAAVPGAWVTAVPVGRTTFPSFDDCFAAERAGGLLGTRARTDADGSFVLSALLPGRYTFYARLATDGDDGDGIGVAVERFGAMLETRDVAAASEPLELVLGVHRLEVRVLDETGAPAEPSTRNARGDPVGSRLELRRLADVGNADWHVLWPSQAGDQLVFEVEPEQEYLASWTDDTVPLIEERVAIPSAPYRVPLELRLGPRGEPATLELRVLDPDDYTFESPLISVLSAASGRVVERSVRSGLPAYNRATHGTWSVELPPGRYRVVASAEALLGCVAPSRLPRTPYAPAEAEVELRAGERTFVELHLGATGHLDFESASEPGPSAMELALFRDRDGVIRSEDARARLGGARVELVSGERRIALERLDIRGVPVRELDWIVPGWSARSLDPIPVGDWTLRVEDDAGAVLERALHIDALRVTVVRW